MAEHQNAQRTMEGSRELEMQPACGVTRRRRRRMCEFHFGGLRSFRSFRKRYAICGTRRWRHR